MRGWVWRKLMELALRVDKRRSVVYMQSIGQQYLELYGAQVRRDVERLATQAIVCEHRKWVAALARQN